MVKTMKKIISILSVIFLVIASCRYENREIKTPPPSILSASLKSIGDTSEILNRFFSPFKIEKNIAVWRPGLDDYFNMPLSEDSLCRTTIDTIIHLDKSKYLLF